MAEETALTSPLAAVGSWKLLRQVGEGATSVVFQGTSGGKTGAVKVLKAGFGLEEAALLASLGRAWGPSLLDVGTSDGVGFVVTEWVDGASVLGVAGDARGVWSVVHAVGRALAELHDAGVRHGDVKPGNVLWHEHVPTRDVPAERAATLIDLGLAVGLGDRARGGTPAYAAPELREGGDVGPRADVFALGVLVRELAQKNAELSRLADVMCARSAGARPSAEWVAERAARELGLEPNGDARRDARVAAVKRTYVALRAREISAAREVDASVEGAPRMWLEEAIAVTRKIVGPALDAPAERDAKLVATSPLLRARWMVSLVGPAAAGWPPPKLDERAFAERLCALAERSPFGAWTYADVRAEGDREPSSTHKDAAIVDDADDAATTQALSRAHVPEALMASAEARLRAGTSKSWTVRGALVDALLRAGESARAMLALDGATGPVATVRRAEVARRLGDAASAGEHARKALDDVALTHAPDGRALRARAAAVLARLAWDAGNDAEATGWLEGHDGVAVAEVRALLAFRKGAFDAGIRIASEALVDEDDALTLARLHATRGFVEHAAGRAEAALADYARAVDLTGRLGAVADEATYLVGVAAAATDAGDVGRALEAATRGALLLERLGRLREASRAWLVRAAALATVGDLHGADEAVAEIAAQGRADAQTRGYARWARVEVRPVGDPIAALEARTAYVSLGGGAGDDGLRAAARVIVWAPDVITQARITELDVASTTCSPVASWEWLGARARRIVLGEEDASAPDVLARLLAIATVPAPLASRGPALAAARDLAMKLGEGEAARRLETLRRSAAEHLRRATPDALKESLASVPWMREALLVDSSLLEPAQIAQLETIVRSLSTRDRLRPLLLQVLDAMVLWVGVERGLLLLRAPNGKLVPRAARNLAREDLSGEQLTLSMTLAKRAMETGEAVVATDAFATFGDVHASVHALKLRSVLAVPLVSRGETFGVVYLDDRGRRGAFGPRELQWVSLLASQAAAAIADARDQVLLRRAVRRAERAKVKVESLLAEREAELFVTQTELSHVRGDETRFPYDAIAGRSEPMRELLHVVDRVTASDVPVLIVGESGTGKELIARAMHANGPRSKRTFVSENCAAVPESLLESTLFGHVRGAFTGASQTRPGLFEVADGGTLFLDEIGEMPLVMQTKLLRVLNDGEVRAVGAERTKRVNVRLIAATHRDLEAMVEQRTFREDLYYRLNVVTVKMPPLRERRDDIPLIVSHLMKKHTAGRKVRFTKAAMERLVSFAWPGNVRQLENEVRRALVLCSTTSDGEDAVIDVSDLSPELLRTDAVREVGQGMRSRVDALEANLLREALTKTHGNQTKAAEILGLSRFGLQKMMRRLKVTSGKPS